MWALITLDLIEATSQQRKAFEDTLRDDFDWKKLRKVTTAWSLDIQRRAKDLEMAHRIIMAHLDTAKSKSGIEEIHYAYHVGEEPIIFDY